MPWTQNSPWYGNKNLNVLVWNYEKMHLETRCNQRNSKRGRKSRIFFLTCAVQQNEGNRYRLQWFHQNKESQCLEYAFVGIQNMAIMSLSLKATYRWPINREFWAILWLCSRKCVGRGNFGIRNKFALTPLAADNDRLKLTYTSRNKAINMELLCGRCGRLWSTPNCSTHQSSDIRAAATAPKIQLKRRSLKMWCGWILHCIALHN